MNGFAVDINVPVAQPDRVTGYEPVGQGFESLRARQKKASTLSVLFSMTYINFLYFCKEQFLCR